MRLTFIINDIATEAPTFTTTRLARRAIQLGHDIALVSLRDLTYEVDETVSGIASVPQAGDYEDDAALLAELQAPDAPRKRRVLTDDDVMLLRADPADELPQCPWAHGSSLLFAQLAAERGVIVLNDPYKLTDASNKTYFQQYPSQIRPRTCITRDPEAIKAFMKNEGGRAVIKPLQGSGGQGVFVIADGSNANLNQMIEATVRDGYAIVQEYLPLANEGDLRVLTMNGEVLQVDGHYACIRRYNDTGDPRSNITVGGKVELVEPGPEVFEILELAGPKIRRDGMYLAGLDIVGNKMMEINVDTPGGLTQLEELSGQDFSGTIIRDLERKVRLRDAYGGSLGHLEIATL